MKPQFTDQDGHQLFADMLREIHAHWCAREDGVAEDQIAHLWRADDGMIAKRYFATMSKLGGELERGFWAALIEYIGSAEDGCGTSPEFYERAPSGANG